MSEPDVSNLLTVAQAIAVIDAVPVSQRTERLALMAADGRRLAEDVLSDRDYPPFHKSQMDGFAIRIIDVKKTPVNLRLVGEVAAGETPERTVETGEAIAIMTGAPLPPGADGVVPIEDVERPTDDVIRVMRAAWPSRLIAARGSDCRAGEAVLKRGVMLGPAQLAVAASVGATSLQVFARPRVAVLCTGDELVPFDQEPGPSQIRNSNNPMLVSLLQRLGCEVIDLGTAPDQPDAIRRAISEGLQHEVLFITGGMSMGTYDYVPRILEELKVDLRITKLRVKPGKPFVFGVGEGKSEPQSQGWDEGAVARDHAAFVFGLPGNPVAGFVCTTRLASRLLMRLGGGVVRERWISGRLDAGLPANGPREFYQPVVCSVPAGGRNSAQNEFATVTPLNWKGSADIYTLALANALLVRAENEPPVPKGTLVRVLEL